METSNLYEIIHYALRVLFLIAVPLAFALALAGTIVGALQAASGIQENTINYLVKILAIILLAYFFMPAVSTYLQQVMIMAYQL